MLWFHDFMIFFPFSWCSITVIINLLYGTKMWAEVFSQFTHLTDRQTDWFIMNMPRLQCIATLLQRGKNCNAMPKISMRRFTASLGYKFIREYWPISITQAVRKSSSSLADFAVELVDIFDVDPRYLKPVLVAQRSTTAVCHLRPIDAHFQVDFGSVSIHGVHKSFVERL